MKQTFWLLALAGLLVFAGATPANAADEKFDFDVLRARAKALAAKPYVAPKSDVPQWLRDLDYDQHRLIEFNGSYSLGYSEKLPFQVQFLHPGFLFDKTVHINELQGNRAQAVPFRREHFNYRTVKPKEIPESMGFAGFRLMFPFEGPGTKLNEIGAFAGASYYRFLCEGAWYGLSARGLALNTAEDAGEEFPVFTDFWLERVAEDATSMNIYALLNSESVTGAYRFTVTPGTSTKVHVKATIFCRKDPGVFGVAPLTSMFWHGENTDASRDFRPEVHDSDGLLLQNGAGEWIWRPLDNPRRIRVSSFGDENPRAFGLLQRDRNFEDYQDMEAFYQKRPSAWVETVGQWGRGAIRLAEFPTNRETNDNIVAFWVPDKLPPPGEPIEIEYRLHWFIDQIASPAGFVRSTRHGKSAFYEPGFERFVVEFDSARLQELQPGANIQQVVTVGTGATLNHSSLQKNSFNGTWRVAFTVKPDGSGRAVELRCYLNGMNESLTETWSFLWDP